MVKLDKYEVAKEMPSEWCNNATTRPDMVRARMIPLFHRRLG